MKKKYIIKHAKECFFEKEFVVSFYLKGDFGTPYEYNAYIEDGMLYIEKCNKKLCSLHACMSNFVIKIKS